MWEKWINLLSDLRVSTVFLLPSEAHFLSSAVRAAGRLGSLNSQPLSVSEYHIIPREDNPEFDFKNLFSTETAKSKHNWIS